MVRCRPQLIGVALPKPGPHRHPDSMTCLKNHYAGASPSRTSQMTLSGAWKLAPDIDPLPNGPLSLFVESLTSAQADLFLAEVLNTQLTSLLPNLMRSVEGGCGCVLIKGICF